MQVLEPFRWRARYIVRFWRCLCRSPCSFLTGTVREESFCRQRSLPAWSWCQHIFRSGASSALFFYLILGLATCGAGPLQYCHVVSHWFDRRTGLALGITMLGMGTGALITPLATQYLIASVGWRLTFSIFGGAALVVTVPVIAMVLRDRPEPLGLAPDGVAGTPTSSQTSNEDPGLSWHEAWWTSTFCALFCAFFLVSGAVQACLSHIASYSCRSGSRYRDCSTRNISVWRRGFGRPRRRRLPVGSIRCAAWCGRDLRHCCTMACGGSLAPWGLRRRRLSSSVWARRRSRHYGVSD